MARTPNPEAGNLEQFHEDIRTLTDYQKARKPWWFPVALQLAALFLTIGLPVLAIGWQVTKDVAVLQSDVSEIRESLKRNTESQERFQGRLVDLLVKMTDMQAKVEANMEAIRELRREVMDSGKKNP